MAGIRITPVDIECLADIGELGLVDTTTIHGRHYAQYSLRGVQNRLRLLAENGFTRIAKLQVSYQLHSGQGGRNRGGALPTLHGLTDLGGDLVERSLGTRPPRVFPKDPSPTTLYHRWRGVQVRLAMDEAIRRQSLADAQWIMEQDMASKVPKGTPPNQCRLLYHGYRTRGNLVTCQPDLVSLMWIPGPRESATPLLGLWENDLSSEGLKQIRGKLPGFQLYVRQKSWKRHFAELAESSDLQVRVFWCCQNLRRAKELMRAVAKDPLSELFRFVEFSALTSDAALVKPIWRTVNGERRAILGR